MRSAQSLARPAVTLKRILIGTKTGDKGLMKELIDNTHCRAYSPQSHSEGHINTWSCAQNGRFFFFFFFYNVQWERGDHGENSWPAAGGREVGTGAPASKLLHHLAAAGLARTERAATSLSAVKRAFELLRATLRDTGL